jgi:glycosyltransferase involved in cell wall biosynthesis
MVDLKSGGGTLDDEAQRRLDEQRRWIDDVARRASRQRVLSTLPYAKVRWWLEAVETMLPRRGLLTPLTARFGMPDPVLVARLLLRAHRYDVVLLNGNERVDLLYAALAAACPWLRTPHVIVDAQWQQASGWSHRLQRWLLRASRRLVVQVQPHSGEEVEIYERAFGVARTRLHAVPWSTSLLGYEFPRVDGDGGFILTGGDAFRDYDVLLQAAGPLGLRVKIALHDPPTPALRAAATPFPHVSLHSDWSHEDFLREMSACRLFVMPLAPALTRATADAMILNAMSFGRIVVASDSIGPRIYIRDGSNGFIVRDRCAAAWSAALHDAWQLNREAYRRIGEQASFDARVHFNEPMRLARTLDAALSAAGGRP